MNIWNRPRDTERLPARSGRSLAALLWAFAPLAMAEPVQLAAPLELDVRAGTSVDLFVGPPLPGDATVTAHLGDRALRAKLAEEGTLVTVFIPSDVARSSKVAIDQTLKLAARRAERDIVIEGDTLLHIYPVVVATATSINKVTRDAYVRPNESFTVYGTGFLAPASAIDFSVLGKDIRVTAETTSVAPDGTSFTAIFSDDALGAVRGPLSTEIKVWGNTASREISATTVWVENTNNLRRGRAALFGLLPVSACLLFLYVISLPIRKARAYLAPSPGERASLETWYQTLLVDPATNTYSLSRLQFVLWLLALVYAYAFVFFARGQVSDEWNFPNLSGTEIAFLISLGTLVGSVATTTAVGPKGAGDVSPRLGDFVVHGGVVALDRLQQLVWTVVAIAIMLTIMHQTAGTIADLPKVPAELLTLMGASSAGYLLGKAARKPGPVVTRVTSDEHGLQIEGRYIGNDARVFIDGVEQPRSAIAALKPNAARPDEFADTLEITGYTGPAPQRVSVINSDFQEAKWAAEPRGAAKPVPIGIGPKINAVDVDKTGVHIRGRQLGRQARIVIDGQEQPRINISVETPNRAKPDEYADALFITHPGTAVPKTIQVINLDGLQTSWSA